jgi:hypothetical protein
MNTSRKQQAKKKQFKAVFRGELAKRENKKATLDSKRQGKTRNHNHWPLSFMAMDSIPRMINPSITNDRIIETMANASNARISEPEILIAMSEMMRGRKAEKTSYPRAFSSMDNGTSTGGFYVPK